METATEPVNILLYDLPKRFRQWIQTLQVDPTAKPLLGLLRKDARYINFNYTEFRRHATTSPSNTFATYMGIEEIKSTSSYWAMDRTKNLSLKPGTKPIRRDLHISRCYSVAKENHTEMITLFTGILPSR